MDCALCQSDNLTQVMDLGEHALAGAFLRPEQFSTERKYPLTLHFCEDCYAVQVGERLSPDLMFKDYFYHSSAIGTLRAHFASYAHTLRERFGATHRTVLEIGCNDGGLLQAMGEQGFAYMTGVDPAGVARTINNPCIDVINDYFGPHLVDQLGEVDLIIANNVFAHILDLNGATRAIRALLAEDGVFVMEVHDLGKMVSRLQYDWVYHEHLYYYSALALVSHFARHGLAIFDIEPVHNHAGSMRYYVCRHGKRIPSGRVVWQLEKELRQGLSAIGTFHDFASRADAHRKRLGGTLEGLSGRGATVAGYGACGRANTMIQYAGLDQYLDFMVDDAPAKHGYYTPGSHLPIHSRAALLEGKADALLVFAWSFLNEIAPKVAGHDLIIPLPDVRMMRSGARLEAAA